MSESTAIASPAVVSGESAEVALGRKLRLLRRTRDLPLQAVADMTGMSIGLLSQVERGLSSPSVKNLAALSAALAVPISWFFDEAVPADEGERKLIVRREARPQIAMSGTGMNKELISPHRGGDLEMFLITLEPGGGTGDEPYSYPGEVGGFVTAGRLSLWLDGTTYLLREGDAFAIPGSLPRRYRNPDPHGQTRLLWAIAGRSAKAVEGGR